MVRLERLGELKKYISNLIEIRTFNLPAVA
jgi:hypothetical protein